MKKILQILFTILIAGFQANAQLIGVSVDNATAITTDEATLNGEISTILATDVDYQFNYGTTSGSLNLSTTLVENFSVTGTTAVSAGVSSLAAETQYFYELYATDGSDFTSAESSFYTLSTIFPSAISDFVVGTTTNSSIQLNWTASSSATTDGYLILYAAGATAPDPTDPSVDIQKGVLPSNQSFANKVVVASDATETETIAGLSPGIQYSFTIIPFNNDGANTEATTNYNLTTYSTVSGFTLATEPTGDPTNPAIGNRTVDEISISYDQVNSANGYLVLWKENSDVAPAATGVEDGMKSTDGSEFTDADGYEYIQGSASTAPIISLPTVGTEYSFRIIPFAHTADEPATYNYRSPGVELLSGFTLSAQPTQPVSNFLVGENKFTDSIYFTIDSYTFPDNGGFLLYYTAGDTPQDLTDLENGDRPETQIAGANLVFESDDAETEIGIGSLNPGSEYSFILPIYNTNGNDDETFHFRKNDAPNATHWTLQSQPSDDIANLNFESKTDGSITLSYDEATGANGYLILYREGNNDPDNNGVTDGIVHSDAADFGQATGFQYVDGGTTLEAEITGLDPKTEYSFRITPYAYALDGGVPVPETYNYNTGSNTKEEEVFTSATIPTDPVTTFEKKSSTTTSITFDWDDYTVSAGFADNGGFLLYYEEYTNADPIDLSTIENGVAPGSQTGLAGFVEITTDDATEVTVTGLDPQTRYKFSIIPYNRDGSDNATIGYNIAGKPDINHYTLSEPASGGDVDAGNFNLTNVTNADLDVNWATVTDADGYLVLYTKSNSALDDSFLENGTNPSNQPYPTGAGEVFFEDVNGGASTTVNIAGLDADTDYAFKVIPYTYLDDGGPLAETYNYNNDNPPLETATTLCVDPSDKVVDLQTSTIDINQMDVSWTNASGLPVLAVARLDGTTQAPPVDGMDYTANNDFSAANQIGASDNFIVYEGTGTTFTLSGLEDFQEYSIDVYVFNDNGFCYENTGETVTETTLCDPATTEVTGTSSTVDSFEEITLNWTIDGAGNNVLIIARETATSAQAPTSNTDYSENNQFGSGQEIGTGNFAVYDGNASTVTVTGLSELTDYSFDIYEYNPTRGGFCYNTTAVTLSATTVCQPPSSAASLNAPTNVTAASVDLSWSAVTGADRYLIVAKEGAAVDLVVSNGDNFEGGVTTDIATSSFLAAADGDGTSGNKIVYANEGTTVTITELSGATQYYFDIYAYVAGTYCYAFGPSSVNITTDPVAASNTLSYNSAATTISSVDNDASANFITVMDFDMNDLGDDGADTKISGFTFTAGASDDFEGSFLWDDIIADARIINNTNNGGSGLTKTAIISTTDNEISVTLANNENNNNGQFGFIGDGGSINMELQIRLKESISVTEIDLKNLVFVLDPNNITIRSGSGFSTTVGSEISTLSTENEIEVEASAFEFTTSPNSPVNAGENVSTQAVVEAKDANGNLDLDYTTNFTISNTGTIPMQNLPTTFSNGEMTFPANFNYQGSGNGTLTITDNAPGNFSAQSSAVTVDPTITLTEQTAGLNSGTLQSGTTEQAVLGFSITALGTTQFQEIEFTTDLDLANVVGNIQLAGSLDNTYDGTATDGIIASSPTIDNGANTISFVGLTENLSTESKNYFLILDVDASVNEFDNTDLTIGVNMTDIVFDNSANKISNDFSKTYGFEDIIDPEVDQVTATPTILSGSDLGTDALVIEITFNEEMDPSAIPSISFPTTGEDPGASLIGPTGSTGWSSGNTVYTVFYDLTDQDVLIENIDVLIVAAKDKSGNNLTAHTENNLFTIDTENPKADPIDLDVASINRPDNTIQLQITFDKIMNNTIDPDFSFNGTAEMSNNGDGAWSGGDMIYTVTFDHSLVEQEVNAASINITNAQDAAGNIMEAATSADFAINTVRSRIDNISATNLDGIYKENDLIEIEITFDQDIMVSGGPPTLSLNSTAIAEYSSVLNEVLTFEYTVGAAENVADLDVTNFNLEGATITNTAGNEAILTLPLTPNRLQDQKDIEIDTRSPEVFNIDLDLATVSQTEEILTVAVEYDEDMDQTSTPSFNFSEGSNLVLTGGGWSDGLNYAAEFTHNLNEEELINVTIEVSGATDAVGNTTITTDSDPFDIDTQSPRITEIISATGDGTYGPGEQVNIKVVFDENIQQTGTAPELTLNTGATASFDNITNGNELNFTYTIGAVNSGENTTDLNVVSISTSENEILDLVNNPSVLTLPSNPDRLEDNSAIVIDTRPAEITNVTSTNLDGKYKEGDLIAVTVTFDEIVTVTATPRIALNSGDFAEYVSGSSSSVLTFEYLVQDSDGAILFDVADLEYQDINSLQLNGGTIVDPASVPVDQSLPTIGGGNSLGDNKNIEIDTRRPEFTVDLDITMVDLNDLTLTVTTNYDEDMDTNSDPSYSFSQANNLIQDNVGNWTDNRTYVETFAHDQTEEEFQNISIEITGATDEVGNVAVTNTSSTFDIDTQKPRITEINSTSSGIFGPGETIDIKVTFDEDIQQTGTFPTLNLNTGGTATFDNITNGNELNFTYTIGAVNAGENTADLNVSSLSNSENEVLDLQANPSVLDLPAGNNLADNNAIIIDTDPADITNVTANPTTGLFKAGDVIDIIVTFNETVVVDETEGRPRILLNTGSYATYSTGSNSNELTFTYTVASAGGSIVDVLDLEYASINSLELNGGTIVDLAAVDAELELPATGSAGSLGDNTDIEIDTTSPIINTIDLDNIEITRANNQLVLTASYNEDMDTSTEPSFSFSVPTNLIRDNMGAWNDNRTYIETFTHNLTEEELQNVTIEVSGATDIVGNTTISKNSEVFTIDTQKPRIVEIVSTSDDILYSPGEDINVQLVFDEDVVVTGNPSLVLNSGGTAIYQNVTNGNQVNFTYTVGGVNSGENTADLDVDQFDMNAGTIKDLVDNDAEIALPSSPNRLQDNADIQVDTNPASIADVTASNPNGFYSIGDVIEISIEFSENTFVVGTPLLELNTGDAASYTSGSGSNVLIFNYVVQAADGTNFFDVADLNYNNVNSIDLNGGTIEDQAGISATLSLPATASANSLGGNKDITIDTQDPELGNNPFTPFNGEFNVSQSLTFAIEMNEPVSGQGTANITLIDDKSGSVVAVLDAGTAFSSNTTTILEFNSFENLLEDSTEYHIEFAAGALVDRAGNEFAGFTTDDTWTFTTFGPPRIDDFSIGACVGEVFTIQGQYFTGVSRIRTNVNGSIPFTISSFTVVDDENIEFTVPAGTVPGTITLDKQIGEAGNTANASTTSGEPIKVGPSSAQLTLVDSNDVAICDIDDQGNENEVEFAVNIVGGNGVYTLVYQVNANDPVTITAFEDGQTFSIVPPDSAQNNVRILSLTDEDEDLNTCSAPNLGTDIEVVKYIRSRVDAGGFSESEDEIGVIELCGANSNIVDFSDEGVVVNSPQINGTIEQGIWTIDEGPSANGGGFSPDFSLKSVQTDRPDTVKYYASFADGVRGEILLKLTSDDPGGLNPCSGTNDLVRIEFVESISVLTERNLSLCISEDENGNQTAIADLSSSVSGGLATDSLTVNWIRIDEFNEEADYDSTWGFKDDENQAKFALSSNVLNPIYKASPLEIQEGRSTLEAAPELVSGVGCGATNTSREVSIRINDIPNPTKSAGPQIVCAGDQDIRYRMNPSSPGNTFEWSFTNGLNEFDGATNSNLVFVSFREVQTEITDTLVVREFNPTTGCESKPDTFLIDLKPLPIANIRYNSTTTISNTANLIPLIGEGGTAGNLVEATQDNGQFFGTGVVQNSNGDYFLDSSQLGVTDITDEEDVHEVFFTFTSEFGCTATDTIAFNVFDAERIFPDLLEAYCQLDAADTINVDPAIVPDGFIVSAINGPGLTNLGYTDVVIGDDTVAILRVLFDPESAYANNPNTENPSNISITYSIEDPNNSANNAEDVGEQIVTVNPLPVLEIDDIEANICSYDENIEFEPIGISGDNFSFKLLNEDLNDTTLNGNLADSLVIGNSVQGFQFDPKPLLEYLTENNKDSIRIFVEYTYTNQNFCSDSREYDFVVWRQPSKPALAAYDLCIVDGVADTAEVTNYFIEAGEEDLSEDELLWYASQDFSADEIGTGIEFVPSLNFFATQASAKFYVVRRNVASTGEADEFCASNATEVTFRRVNNPEFTWNKSTYGVEDIIFTGDPNQAALASTEWIITKIDGADEEVLAADAFTELNDSTIAVDFNTYGAGRYRVKFRVSTENACSAEVSRELVILPEATVAESYSFNFDNSSDGWVSSGFKRNSTDTVKRLWDFAIPSGESNFEASESLWITNADGSYESNIESYVYSPSMDISDIERPVVSFDLWLNMAQQEDGLVLEYSTDNKVIEDSEKTWFLLGELTEGVSSGLEWYNETTIEAQPGTLNGIENNNPLFVGWSLENNAESIGSVNAKHSLEEIANRENVVFRFQFKSTSSENQFGNRDGAAFDNFKIESLNRNVLVEYFGDTENLDVTDTTQMNAINQQFNTSGNFAWINYRINPNDSLYQQQSSAMLSRVYFYDAYDLGGQFAIDGEINTETFNDVGSSELSKARLFSSVSNINLNVSNVNEDELEIDVDFQSTEDFGKDVNLYIAVLQKEISGGGITYYNVLRKLLPGNSGIQVTGTSGQQTVNFKASRPSDENALAVVAFLQNTETAEVIQSAYTDDFSELSFSQVTSIDRELSALNLKLFPNPAYDNLNILWDMPMQEEVKAQVIDVTGKIIKEFKLLEGDQAYELNTSSLKTGMYNLIFTNPKGQYKMMKFVVTN